MVSLEAAAHGLPTVAFNVGGVPDAIASDFMDNLVMPGDYAALADRIIHQLARRNDESVVNTCRDFAASKTWPIFSERLCALLEAMSR